MDSKITQNFDKTAKNIISHLRNRVVEPQDYFIFYKYFKFIFELKVIKRDDQIALAEALIDAELSKEVLDINLIKDDVCKDYAELLNIKTRH